MKVPSDRTGGTTGLPLCDRSIDGPVMTGPYNKPANGPCTMPETRERPAHQAGGRG
jgi:hypothetical protein